MGQVTLNGSCLCGGVKYEASGNLQRFYHCHCSRCRKSSGTGHATNLMLAEGRLVFTQGESELQKYKVPEAEFFTRQFCRNCGSHIARYIPERNVVVIPAGSLDCEPPILPQARIFWDSRAAWACDGDDLTRFAESAQ